METLHTPHGELPVTGLVERHSNGALKSCRPEGEAVLFTPVGEFTPQHTTDDLRRRTVQPLSFHTDGTLRSLPLERPTVVVTPAGAIPAELVTFHDSGSISRVFPLNGRLSGFWSEEDEAGLATPVILNTPIGVKHLKIIAAGFWPDGALRSLTLWPDEIVTVPTPAGEIKTRIGVGFHPDGTVSSVEPAKPVQVQTPIGLIRAFDPDAVGINGDSNSLEFDEQGALIRISTVQTRVTVSSGTGVDLVFEPVRRESLCGDTDFEPEPLRIEFTPDTVIFYPDAKTPPTVVARSAATFSTGSSMQLFAGGIGVKSCGM